MLEEAAQKAVPVDLWGAKSEFEMTVISGCVGFKTTKYENVDIRKAIFSDVNPTCTAQIEVEVPVAGPKMCNRLFTTIRRGYHAAVQRKLVIAALIILVVTHAFAQHSQSSKPRRICKGNPELVGQCFQVRGRAFASNGTPDLRIWRVGTNRILGVTASKIADDADDPIAPPNLLRALAAYDHFVFGNFEVCPFTPERDGEMQMVCVERADNLVIKPYGVRRSWR